jgi:hypothetical protein
MRPSPASQLKLALLVTVTLWISALGLLVCAVGFTLGGGFSPVVALVPTAAILLGGSHAAVGWAQQRWEDTRTVSRLGLSSSAAAGFGLGLAGALMLRAETPWVIGTLPTVACLVGLVGAMRFSGRGPASEK